MLPPGGAQDARATSIFGGAAVQRAVQFLRRRFDCLNESRPGVTSAVLTPQQAVYYLERAVGEMRHP